MTEPKPVARLSDLPKDEGFYAKHKETAEKMCSWLKVGPFYPPTKPRSKKKKAQ